MLDELATYLADAGIGLTIAPPTPNVFTIPFPENAPDTAVCLVTYDADIATPTFGESLSAPSMVTITFKAIARAPRGGATAAAALAFDVYRKLRRLGPVDLEGVRYHNIDAAPPRFLSFDEPGRPRYHFDATAWRAEAAA